MISISKVFKAGSKVMAVTSGAFVSFSDSGNINIDQIKQTVGFSERNQQDATNLVFIIKLLSQHVSGTFMPIFRRTRLCITAYGVLHWLCWLWLCGVGMRAACTV